MSDLVEVSDLSGWGQCGSSSPGLLCRADLIVPGILPGTLASSVPTLCECGLFCNRVLSVLCYLYLGRLAILYSAFLLSCLSSRRREKGRLEKNGSKSYGCSVLNSL